MIIMTVGYKMHVFIFVPSFIYKNFSSASVVGDFWHNFPTLGSNLPPSCLLICGDSTLFVPAKLTHAWWCNRENTERRWKQPQSWINSSVLVCILIVLRHFGVLPNGHCLSVGGEKVLKINVLPLPVASWTDFPAKCSSVVESLQKSQGQRVLWSRRSY